MGECKTKTGSACGFSARSDRSVEAAGAASFLHDRVEEEDPSSLRPSGFWRFGVTSGWKSATSASLKAWNEVSWLLLGNIYNILLVVV